MRKQGGLVEDKVLEETTKQTNTKTPRKRKAKTWGDEGFTAQIYYGAYTYTVKFVKEEVIRKFVHQEDESMSVFGGVNCYQQEILICSETTP